jgi:hypothetical protein
MTGYPVCSAIVPATLCPGQMGWPLAAAKFEVTGIQRTPMDAQEPSLPRAHDQPLGTLLGRRPHARRELFVQMGELRSQPALPHGFHHPLPRDRRGL